jgi:hypothetical protein
MTIAQAARTYELFVGIDIAATAVEVSIQRPGAGNLIGGFGSGNLFDCSLHMGQRRHPCATRENRKARHLPVSILT